MDGYSRYIEDIDIIEDRVVDDTKYPVVTNRKIKICCKYSLEILKLLVYNVGLYIDATKKEKAVNSRNNQSQRILNCQMMNQQ